MKKKLIIVAVGALVICGLLLSSGALAAGQHSYKLNIIGVDDKKNVGDSMGHTLFVKLDGKTRIIMTQAEDGVFQVTDRNGLQGPAEFNIAPGVYDVYARALGSPKGDPWVNITSYYNLTTDGAKGLFLGTVDINRTKGKPQSIKITHLFCLEGAWIFNIDELDGYYWEYDNHNLKLLQVRFYKNLDACELPA